MIDIYAQLYRMKTIFSLDNDVLGRLDPTSATKAFRNLLWCESRRVGLSPHRVVISLSANVSDGGIDARVDGVPESDSVLVSGVNYFQIKTGQRFKTWQISSLKKELFGSSRATPTRKNLAPEVRECLRSHGRYVVVTFGYDLTSQNHSKAKNLLAQFFKECGFKKPDIEVLGQSQLLGLVAAYPSLSLDLAGKAEFSFLNISAWQARDDMSQALQLASTQLEFVETIRSAIRDRQYQHVRVIGEPGIGKTRLVLEALSADDLAAQVIYISHAEDFQNSRLLNEFLRGDIAYTVILVVDECIEKERVSIWAALKGKGGIQLITIDHGPERSSDEGMLVIECPKLPEDQVKAIVAQYLPQYTDASHWAKWCDGIPRVAHAVGENLQRNPDDLLKPPATVPLWERFVAGYEDLDSKNAQDGLTILRHVALFARFGYEDPVSSEAKFVSTLAQSVDPSITWARFQEIVERLRNRRILQGKRTLFIVPKALHIHLWIGYWNTYGRGFDFQTFFDSVPTQLRHWFLQLFIYGHASPVAQDIVANILSPTGPFSSRDFVESEAGCRFMNYLAEADPGGALGTIERTLGTWSQDELKQWTEGRQNVVWALEKIAVWREHFLRAADVLVRMVLAENADNSNNSTGMLNGLFMVGVGWAGTQASPEERFPVVRQLLEGDTVHKELGLSLSKSWLSTYGGYRIVGAEYQGLRPELQFWRPKIWGEIFDAWRHVWRYVYSVSRGWSDVERRRANDILIDASTGLLYYKVLADEVIQTLFQLADDPVTDIRHLTHMVIRGIKNRAGKLPRGILTKLSELDKKLTGDTFLGRFRRYVLNTTFDEDYRVRKGEIKESLVPTKRVENLIAEVIADISIFTECLPKFVTEDGHRLYEFGLKLGELPQSAAMLEVVITAQIATLPEKKTQFISGFFTGLKKIDPVVWETATLRLLNNLESQEIGTAIIFSSGLSENVLTRMLHLYQQGQIKANAFSRLGWRDIPEYIPHALVESVLGSLVVSLSYDAMQMAIELADNYFFNDKNPRPCGENLLFDLISGESFFHDQRNTMVGYNWASVVKGFRQRFPARDLDLLNVILHHLNDTHSDPSNIAEDIAKDHPVEAWTIVRALLDTEDHNYWLIAWLGDRSGFGEDPPNGAIQYFDPHSVISWVSINPERNAWKLLRCLPKTLNENEGGRLTLLFLEEYGDDDRLSTSLILHFSTGGWSGPESAYLVGKRDKARAWISRVESAKVLSWLYRYIDSLNKRITAAEISEEREF